MAKYPGFVGPAYRSQNPIAAADTCVNWYPSKLESGTGKAAYQLLPCPGFSTYCDLGIDNPPRGFYDLNGASWTVAGDTLYQLPFTSGGSATELADGITNPDDSIVSIAGSGDVSFQLMIASSGVLYCYDISTDTLTEIPGISASYVTYTDGAFYALDPTTSNLYVSAPADGSSWDVLDVIQRSDYPDKWVALMLSHGELWLPGSQSGSVYFNSNAAEFPFSPNPSGKLQRGTVAPNSMALVDGTPMWLSQNENGGLVVVKAQGYQMQRVSTHAMEYAWSQYSTVIDADAFSYQEQGHTFYVLNFPTANKTWSYDATEGLWHQRGPWEGNDYGVLGVRGHVFANGAHLVGSRSDGLVYEMRSPTRTTPEWTLDVGGQGMVRQRRAPHLCEEKTRINYHRFELDMEVGIGLQSGQGSDPQVMLRWSNDGGQTWGNVHTASAGPIGAFSTLPRWRMLGQGRDRVFEVSVSDPVYFGMIDAYLDYSVGAR